MNKSLQPQDLRIIQTARTVDEINNAARAGFFPLVKKVSPSPEIRSKFAVYQNMTTGEIKVSGDYRSINFIDDLEEAIGFTSYYPYNFPNPFAAYLIPSDLKVGEIVVLKDLIEDLVGGRWNQGDAYRLSSCEAEWTGKDFIIHYDEHRISEIIG